MKGGRVRLIECHRFLKIAGEGGWPFCVKARSKRLSFVAAVMKKKRVYGRKDGDGRERRKVGQLRKHVQAVWKKIFRIRRQRGGRGRGNCGPANPNDSRKGRNHRLKLPKSKGRSVIEANQRKLKSLRGQSVSTKLGLSS